MAKNKYSFWIGLLKTAKNSAWMLIPFVIAMMATVPMKYAWISGPLVYLLKNYLENRK